MFRFADLSLATLLLAPLALSACAMNDLGDAVSDTRSAIGDEPDRPLAETEFSEVARNCQIPGATLRWLGTGRAYRLTLPADAYAARDRTPADVRLTCITRWANERGLTLTLAEAR